MVVTTGFFVFLLESGNTGSRKKGERNGSRKLSRLQEQENASGSLHEHVENLSLHPTKEIKKENKRREKELR